MDVIGSYLKRVAAEHVPAGRCFILQDWSATGDLLCMRAQAVGAEPLIVVIGGPGAERGPHWFTAEAIEGERVVLLPEGLAVRPVGAQCFGLPIPTRDRSNGALGIAEGGVAWIYVANAQLGSRAFFDLRTGEPGNPEVDLFPAWELLLPQPEGRDPIVVYRHG